MSLPLLDAKKISKSFFINGKQLQAVNDVSFTINSGETFGLAGESGCGKSTLGKLLIRLLEPSEGSVLFEGRDLFKLKGKDLKEMRRNIQMVFQNPSSSLNPKMTIEDILYEPYVIQGLYSKIERKERILDSLNCVGLQPSHLTRLPDELSGGQKQRVSIARALSLNPRLLICDESLSALDVTIQSQIIDLLQTIQEKEKLAFLFISHDLAAMRFIAHRIAIMYLGEIVEVGPTEEIFNHAKHPYTQSLLSSILVPDPISEKKRVQVSIRGDIPSAFNIPKGCPFHTRCPFAMPICQTVKPQWKELSPGHAVQCHLS